MELKKLETILQENPKFPSLLKEIPNPASKIYVLGELSDDPPAGGPKIAIVGTRKATSQGRAIAKEMAKKLSERGMIIVSGLAMGIDTASHEGAVAAGNKTIAVLACGLNTIYPRQNENLAKKIIETGGAIISEYPIGTPALPNQFLERNRIISGLSIATIIIEAPKESGALVTARLSAEQGREIFVVPGPINHPNYYGSHKLIRDGARLVASVDDILEDLGISVNQRINQRLSASTIEKIKDKNQLLILKIIQEAGQPLNIDKIIELTKLESQVVNRAIAILIINGLIKETEKGYAI
jgi:DNA processing protein